MQENNTNSPPAGPPESAAPVNGSNVDTSQIYPSATKGFMGSVSTVEPVPTTPEKNDNEQLSQNGSMLFYVSTFSISLFLIATIVGTISGLFEVVFNQIGKKASSSGSSYFDLSSYELKAVLWLVASLVISFVIYALIVLYLKRNDTVVLNSFSTKVYGFVYGTFLTLFGLAGVSSFTLFVYSCFVPLVPKDEYASAGSPAWIGIVQSLLTTLLIFGVLFYYYKKAKSSSRLS